MNGLWYFKWMECKRSLVICITIPDLLPTPENSTSCTSTSSSLPFPSTLPWAGAYPKWNTPFDWSNYQSEDSTRDQSWRRVCTGWGAFRHKQDYSRPLARTRTSLLTLLSRRRHRIESETGNGWDATYCLPIQFLGPMLNGWRAAFLSSANRGSVPSQRSGMKLSGSAKLAGEWKVA